MNEEPHPRERAQKQTREERLAAKLRENLRRRKAQAKAVAGSLQGVPGQTAPVQAASGESGGLPKAAPES